jgi:hypothetical protein
MPAPKSESKIRRAIAPRGAKRKFDAIREDVLLSEKSKRQVRSAQLRG